MIFVRNSTHLASTCSSCSYSKNEKYEIKDVEYYRFDVEKFLSEFQILKVDRLVFRGFATIITDVEGLSGLIEIIGRNGTV